MLTNFFSSESTQTLLQRPDTLAVIPMRGRCAPGVGRAIGTGLIELGTGADNEVWRDVDQVVSRGTHEDISWSKSDRTACVALWLDLGGDRDIEGEVARSYMHLISFLKDQGFGFLLRGWQYLPTINAGEGDHELYKRFCSGRLQAFDALGLAQEMYPAASALGHHVEGAVIFLFASKTAPVHLTNAKQVDAYHYPREYGVSSPSFARASVLIEDGVKQLFISGTASILGHQTVAPDSVLDQLQTTVDNIEQLLSQADMAKDALTTMKIYLRQKESLESVQAWLSQRYPQVQKRYFHADICRSSLSVEIEGFCQ